MMIVCVVSLKKALILKLADRLRINLTDLVAVGDSLRDIEAARAVGATPILVRTGKGKKTIAEGLPKGVAVYDDLLAASLTLIKS